jgi:taurine--2-oxoglutarate transaminase
VQPDLITVAKGMASGYATIGAVIVSEKVAHHFDEAILACGLTYYAHPTSVAAALETMKIYEEEHMYENAAALGSTLRYELETIAARVAPRTFVRSLGLLGCLEIEAPLAQWPAFASALATRKLSLHVEGKRQTAIVSPPLCITESELVTGVRALGDAAVAAFGAK